MFVFSLKFKKCEQKLKLKDMNFYSKAQQTAHSPNTDNARTGVELKISLKISFEIDYWESLRIASIKRNLGYCNTPKH